MKTLKIIISFFFLVISGCNFNPFIQDELSEDDKLFAENYIKILQLNDINKAKSFFSEELLQTNIDWLDSILLKINKEEIKNKKLVYQKVLNRVNPYRVSLTYELEYSNYWLLMELSFDKTKDDKKVVGLYYYTLKSSFEDLTTFKIGGKSITHYLILILSISVLLFIVYTLILCIKTSIRKKWLWIILILLGISKISFNWSSGTFDYQILSFQILGFSIIKYHPYGSWILSTSIPLGAILFSFKKRRMKSEELINTDKDENIAISG